MRIPAVLPRAGSKPFDVVAFGLNSVDLLAVVERFPQPNSKQRLVRAVRMPGGQCATAMVACARLGLRARYLGRFGDDAHGQEGIESLRHEGVDVSAAEVMPHTANQFAVILVDASTGERTVLWDRPQALYIPPDEVRAEAVTSGRVLLVDCHDTPAVTRAAGYARAAGIPTVIDVEHVRPQIDALLREITIIIAAEQFPERLTGEASLGRALQRIADEFRPAVTCVTLGASGSLALVNGREIRTPGFQVPVVDSTGAGDVFRGAFIAAWLHGGESADAGDVLRFANAAAALKCRVLGARQGIPYPQEVAEFLDVHR